MTAPVWRSQNTSTSGTTTILATMPTGFQANDILMLAITGAEGSTIATPSGWTKIGSTLSTSTHTNGTALAVFWKRATGSEVTLTIADSGDHTLQTMHAISGCITTGDPIDDFTPSVDNVANTSLALGGPNTTKYDTLLFIVAAHGRDVSNAQFSSYGYPTNTTTPQAKRSDNSTISGVGGGIGTWTTTMPPVGYVGSNFTATIGGSTLKAGFVIALKPPIPNSCGVLLG